MASMSDNLENLIARYIFRVGTFTQPTTLAHCLLTTWAANVDSDTGQFSTGNGVEVTNANAYARVDRPAHITDNWSDTAGGDGQIDNINAITFATASGGNWGIIVGLAITDNTTHDSGALYFHGAVTVSKSVDDGDTAEIAAGALTVTFA